MVCILFRFILIGSTVSACPFALVEHPLWKAFFKRIRPAFNPPKRKTLGSTYLEKHMAEAQSVVQKEVQETATYHLQCDGWSNVRNEGIINFVLNKPEPIFVKQVATDVKRHTADNLYDFVMNVLNEYDPKKCCVIIGDNANNIQAAFNKVEESLPHVIVLRCVNHTLNLLCKDITKVPSIATFINDSNEVVSHIKKSQVLNTLFNKMKKKSLASAANVTRWGTNETSLRRLLINKHAL